LPQTELSASVNIFDITSYEYMMDKTFNSLNTSGHYMYHLL